MKDTKVKIFTLSGFTNLQFGKFDTDEIEKQMNEFISNNNIEVIDIRLTATGQFLIALLLYKAKE